MKAICWATAIWLCAQAGFIEAQAAERFEDATEQGVLYVKRDLFKQAKTELDKAYKLGGDKDFRTVYYRGFCAYKLLLLEQAFAMLEVAKPLAKSEKETTRLQEWETEMKSLFGAVRLKTAEGETNARGRIFLESKTGIINKEKKQRFLSLRERYRASDVALPMTVYLPYGDYLVNRVPVSINEGEEIPEVEIYFQIQQTAESGKGGGISPWWLVGVGGLAAVAAGVGAYFLFSEDEEIRTERLHGMFE